MKKREAKRRKGDAQRKTESDPHPKLAGSDVVSRDFSVYIRICEALVIAGGVFMTIFGTFAGHKILFVWAAGLTLCALIIGFCFWFAERESKREIELPSTNRSPEPSVAFPIRTPSSPASVATVPTPETVLAFRAMATAIGNLPERKRVSMTWDGKPWDEAHYSDVRLTMENTFEFPLQNIDLTISATDGNETSRIAGIGQLSDVNGIEYHPPKSPELPPLSLRGEDGNLYRLPTADVFGSVWLPATTFRIFCPRLLPGEPLRLIIATVQSNKVKRPPVRVRITGVYETGPSEGSVRGRIDEVVTVDH